MRVHFHLPKLFCPFVPTPHPEMRELEVEALERWAKQLGLHSRHKAFCKLKLSRFPLLLARCHPTATKEQVNLMADFVIWNFLWGDQVDSGAVNPEWTRQQNELAMDILRGAMPDNEAPPLFWILADLRDRMLAVMPPEGVERFLRGIQAYFDGTAWKADTRSKRHILDVATCTRLRRLTSAFMPLTLMDAVEGIRLTDELRMHPAISQLVTTAVELLGWANDIFSPELDTEDAYHPNLVLSLQKEQGVSLEEALALAVERHDLAMLRFLELEQQVPSFGGKDADVACFVATLRRWIRANIDWSIETGRSTEPGATPMEELDAAPRMSAAA
jgi:hypothetical protein